MPGPSGVLDYVVGFKVFEGKSLQTEDGGPCDPFVLVECCDYDFQTATMENKVTKSLVQWNEGFIWPDVQLHPKQFEAATIEFNVYSRYWISRNYLIGTATMQLSFINNRPRHLYARTWLQLKREGSPECTGELNVSVYALKPGQQAPSATEQSEAQQDPTGNTQDAGDDMEDLSKHVLKATPEAPSGRAHYLKLIISRVEDLRDLSFGRGPPSPWVSVEFAGCLVRTARGDCVSMYTFNEEVLIPVTPPIFEDLVVIKLWSGGSFFSSDELIAQGAISFRALRNEAMAPRWFNLYGWNEDELSDASGIAESGVQAKPNYFKGRLLLSGRVETVREGEDLQKGASMPTRPVPDPGTMQLALLADVYMVTGAEGMRCRCEVSFGAASKSTGMVNYDAQSISDLHREGPAAAKPAEGEEDQGEQQDQEVAEDVNSFTFTEKSGRIDPLLVMTPEDPESQPRVLVNVYTEGRFQSERRIGYVMCSLCQFPMYDHGCPSKPQFLALESMPDTTPRRIAPSVQITIERHNSDEVLRHNRKTIKPMIYIVRSYCSLARRIQHDGMAQDSDPSRYGLRISCAGMSRTTTMLKGPRPAWMEHMDMKVILCSDSVKEAPTMEPITVTLVEEGRLLSMDLGQAVCIYTHLRKRDNLGRWEPYKLEPQWIQILGVNDGRPVAEVLIAFELLTYKHREELALQPREMWPQPEASFEEREHFCKLKKATLHFSLQGLRDLVELPNIQSLGFISGWQHVTKPMVTVEVHHFFKPDEDLIEDKKLTFYYRDVVPGGDRRIQAQALQQWKSKLSPERDGSNFEFLQVGKMNVLIPDLMLLQPYLTIKVWEQPSEMGLMGQAFGYDEPTLVGESLQSLADHLPCCWLEGVSLEKSYSHQRSLIKKRLAEARDLAQVRSSFKQLSAKELKDQMAQPEGGAAKVTLKVQIFGASGIGAANATRPFCTCEIRGKPGSRIKTGIGSGTASVVWDHEALLANYAAGDTLFFRVRDKDRPSAEGIVGSTSLAGDRFYPGGFEGELSLKGPWGQQMKLKVRVAERRKEEVRRPSKWRMIKAETENASDPTADIFDREALPMGLRKQGQAQVQRRPLPLGMLHHLNMQAQGGFSPRKGDAIKSASEEHGRKFVHGKLENSLDIKTFKNDFWYKAMPLLRNHDIVGPEDEDVDWFFQPQKTFGFVKCAFKLTDGWEEDEVPPGLERVWSRCLSFNPDHKGLDRTKSLDRKSTDSEALAPAEARPHSLSTDSLATAEARPQDNGDDKKKLRRSFEFDEELDSYAFEEKLFEEKFKGPLAVPSRVRVRLYLVKAVCIFGKSSGFADPYIEFQLGRYITVSMQNMVRFQTNTPDFYNFEERDIQLPVDGRLEVRVMDYDDTGSTLIGSTVIDLEDRWHSPAWHKVNEAHFVPLESRPLFTAEYPGKNRGSLEMWIEMIESTRASDVHAADIRKPAEIEVEVRFVIWGTSGVKLWKDGYTNVKLSTKIDCKEYGGDHPALQETDIHYNSKDGKAVFNWRVVYPKIQMPAVACSVQFSLYHAETFGDDLIGCLDFNLQEYLAGVSKDLTARIVGPGNLSFQSIDSPDDDDVGSVSVTLFVLTQVEASSKRQGLGQSEPNDDPQLITPIEGREWGDYLSTFQLAWPDFGLWKKALPLIIAAVAFLFSAIFMKQIGLL